MVAIMLWMWEEEKEKEKEEGDIQNAIVRARPPPKPIAELLFLTLARHNFVNFRFWMN